MRTIVINQHDNYITDEKLIEKIKHMVNHGYGSIEHNGLMASYTDCQMVEGDRIIFINVEEAA